jgi:hypothetical protein
MIHASAARALSMSDAGHSPSPKLTAGPRASVPDHPATARKRGQIGQLCYRGNVGMQSTFARLSYIDWCAIVGRRDG